MLDPEAPPWDDEAPIPDPFADECGGLRDHEGETSAPRGAQVIPTNNLAASDAAAPAGPSVSPLDVIGQWRTAGPLVHEPTGLEALDALIRGGLVYGERAYIAGAPDAGKTALLVQLLSVAADAGVAVGLLAVDEEPSDVVMRLMQRLGFTRTACEVREPDALDVMEAKVADLPVRLYSGDTTIETAADDLAAYARERGSRAMLGIDSVQTVKCDAEAMGADMSGNEAVTARVQAIRSKASEHRLIVVATSEMNRGAYRSKVAADRVDDMAAGKWSGAIEYSARVLLALRSVPGESDVIELGITKNKHGPSGSRLYLDLDRSTQRLTESDYEPPAAEDRGASRTAENVHRAVQDAAAVATVLVENPGKGKRDVRDVVRAQLGFGSGRADVGLAKLGEALIKVPGPGKAQHHYLDGSKLPDEVLAAVDGTKRNAVISARPPTEENAA